MKRSAPLCTFALLFIVTGAAWGNDNIVSTVTPLTNPYSNPPIVQINGVSQGNIRLVYTVVGTQFPCGPQNPFATFNLGMLDQRGSGPVRGSYPATLALADAGNGTPVQLAPSPNSFIVNGIGWSDNSNVSINIDCGSLPPPTDGEVIDGQMNESASTGSHLNTISTIQVHIMLVFPTNACVKLYSFESDQNTFDVLTGVTVIPMNAFTKSTDPAGVSVDGMVVNTCTAPQSFDIAVNLGQYWQNVAGSSIGSSTYTYATSGEFDPTNYGLAAWGTSTPQGETLCVKNFTLAPGYSMLMRVYSGIIPFTPLVNLPAAFPYSATLYSPSSNCSGNVLPGSLVGPHNPATSSLPWTY